MVKKAVVVLSGGLDSTTCMGIAKEEGFQLYPLTFNYGQRHKREVQQAAKISAYYQAVKHQIVDVNFLSQIGGSSLTDKQLEVRTGGILQDIPATYVPARNMIFLALAAAYAETINAEKIYIGVSSVDYSGYPDCRPEFIQSMEETINLGTRNGVLGKEIKLETPLLYLSKCDTIRTGLKLGVPYQLTTSCYQGGEEACGVCDSCLMRIKGFKEAGAKDPIVYRNTIDWEENDYAQRNS